MLIFVGSFHFCDDFISLFFLDSIATSVGFIFQMHFSLRSHTVSEFWKETLDQSSSDLKLEN